MTQTFKIERAAFKSRQTARLIEQIRAQRQELGKQFKIANLLEIDPTQISKYENGRVHPSVEYLMALSQACRLPYVEEYYWLGLAGHIPPTRMPSAHQITQALELYCSDIANDVYPCIIIDYRLGIWAMNQASYSVNGFTKQKATTLLAQGNGNLLEMIFSELVNEVTDVPVSAQQTQVALFQSFNLHRRHEYFYEQFEQYMQTKFGRASYAFGAFKQCWDQIDVAANENVLTTNTGGFKVRGITLKNGEPFLLHERLEIIPHLPQFAIVRFEPQKSELAEMIDAHPAIQDSQVLKLWDVMPNVNGYVDQYNEANLIDTV